MLLLIYHHLVLVLHPIISSAGCYTIQRGFELYYSHCMILDPTIATARCYTLQQGVLHLTTETTWCYTLQQPLHSVTQCNNHCMVAHATTATASVLHHTSGYAADIGCLSGCIKNSGQSFQTSRHCVLP
jgi:hypothetical protein